jgi:hypothetical protein
MCLAQMSKRLINLNIQNRCKKIKKNVDTSTKVKAFMKKIYVDDIWKLRLKAREDEICGLMMNPPWYEEKSLKKFVCLFTENFCYFV